MFGKNKNGCFACDDCPQNNDPAKGRFCVAWFEAPGFRDGKPEVRKSCGFPVIFDLLVQNCAASDRVTANLTVLPSRLRETLIPPGPKLIKRH